MNFVWVLNVTQIKDRALGALNICYFDWHIQLSPRINLKCYNSSSWKLALSRSIKLKLMNLSNICQHFAFIIKHVFSMQTEKRQRAINQFINMKNDTNHWHRSNICSCWRNSRTSGLWKWDTFFRSCAHQLKCLHWKIKSRLTF